MKILFLAILFFSLSLLSCKKVIDVPITNAAPQIVINGEVTNQPGPYQVAITHSVNYGADNSFPPVSGASVAIRDNAGLYDSLLETSPGVYTTHSGWQGLPGNSYTLAVTVSGAAYTATSIMPQPVNLDSVGFQQQSRGRSNTNDVISAIPFFQDPPGIANYYEYKERINGTPLNQIFIFSDRLSDGKYISQPARDDSAHLHEGDQLLFSMYCIDKTVYQYLFELDQVVSGGNGFTSVTPANPTTNLSNGALGCFSAHTLQIKETIVHLP